MKHYAHPEVLVDPRWVAAHLSDPQVRIVDAHVDPAGYESGHIPGAVAWNAFGTLLTPDWRMNLDRASVEDLCGRSGIANDTTVVVYAEQNAVAPWVFWFLSPSVTPTCVFSTGDAAGGLPTAGH